MIDGAVRWVKTGGILTVNSSTETYQAACIAGLGIIQVPRTGVREALRAGDLIEILPQYRAEPLPVSLIYPHRRNPLPPGKSVYGVAGRTDESVCRLSGAAGKRAAGERHSLQDTAFKVYFLLNLAVKKGRNYA